MRYSWPGNVRELENLIEMLVVMKEGTEIILSDIPEKIRQHQKEETSFQSVAFSEYGISLNDMVSDFERNLILKALETSGGVKNKAARLLNLNRTTLVEKLKRLNISSSPRSARRAKD